MQAHAIAEKAKFVTDVRGRPKEVILPYRLYRELIRLKMSQEIYERPETQEAIGKAKKDLAAGRVRRFHNVIEALRWLDE